MATNRMRRMNPGILLLSLTLVALSLTHCDADRSTRLLKKNPKKLKITKHFDLNPSIYSSNALSSPSYESLATIPLLENSSPYCVYPPPTATPTPISFQPSPPYYYSSPYLPTQNPPPTITPGPPENLPTPTPESVPSPPESLPTPTPESVPTPPSVMPGSPEPIFNPPIIFPGPPGSSMSPPSSEPAPPYYEPTTPFLPSPTSGTIPSPPPSTVPSPTTGGTNPSPTVFEPPVVYPPPSVPPPPNTVPQAALWCVAKPSVPDPIVEEAMNYACWSGADCTSIQPNGPCYKPDTIFAHASYAFNSYWQRTKVSGGTCEFGGTAMLVAVDPSFDGCHFIYN